MIITVMDTETTGLDRKKHEIIEIALISYVVSEDGDRYVVKKFNSKVKPRHIETASARALEINHYNKEDWKDALDISEILPEIQEMIIRSDVMIGQNLIFDLRRLHDAYVWNHFDAPEYPPYVDTKAMADSLKEKNRLKKSGMDYLCEHYKVEFEGKAHSALADCERTMLVWDKLLEEGEDYELYCYEKPYEPHFRR